MTNNKKKFHYQIEVELILRSSPIVIRWYPKKVEIKQESWGRASKCTCPREFLQVLGHHRHVYIERDF